MKLDTFFDKFDQFADAPDAVEKMRELVLDLAVQGKVADQDPNDEPAAELLKRLITFKLDNPLSGRSGRSKESPVKVEATSDGLPENWVNTTIGEVLYVIRGASPRPKGDPQYFSETRTPYHWVKISDIRKHGQNGLLMDTDEFLTEAGMRKSVLLPKGTLVLTNSATIGVPIVLGIEGCCIHDGYLAFPNFPHDLLSQKFLLYLFHTLKKHAERNARGLAQLNLNTDLVRSFPFGLPPLAEQKRIVAKVDELMALCDRVEVHQKERETRHAALARASLARFADAPTPANLQLLFHPSYAIPPASLRKSILTLAVQGKLAPSVEKEHVTLGEVIELISGQHLLAHEHNETGNGIPYLTGPSDFGPKHPVPTRWTETPKVVAEPGDILVTVKGSGVGKTNKLVSEQTAISRQLMAVRVVGADPDFVQLVLMNAAGHFQESMTGIAIPGIGRKDVLELEAELPPLAEQRRIVAKVEQLMALVDELEAQLAASRVTGANLLSALVDELTTKA